MILIGCEVGTRGGAGRGHKPIPRPILPDVTRYGFSYKALPKGGGKPFGSDDEDDETQEAALGNEDAHEAAPEGGEGAEDDALLPPAPDSSETDVPPPGPSESGEDGGAAPPEQAPPPPADDSRPWAGDRYDEGDETEPDNALYGYTGVGDEQAWLDKDPDGALTGWVRDSTGQVWRYTDVDAWAADVDGAQMTRTHSRAEGDAVEPPAQPGAAPGDRGEQDLMFANQ